MTNPNKIRIATRGSQLALWQANYVADLLSKKGLAPELNIIKTEGDRVQNRFLHEMGGKGLFVRELEEAMKDGRADLAVHSLKDLPAKIPQGYALPAILKRHIPNDVMILNSRSKKVMNNKNMITRQELQSCGPLKIATASLRRQSLLKGLGSGIELVSIRGNVDTRIRKLEESDWDALILAGASIERLNLMHLPHRLIDHDWFVPCAAQGALAIETSSDSVHRSIISTLSDPWTFACATLERKILELLGGDCTMPFGAFAQFADGNVDVRTVVLDYEGKEVRVLTQFHGTPDKLDIEASANRVLQDLEKKGVNAILKTIANKEPDMGPLA